MDKNMKIEYITYFDVDEQLSVDGSEIESVKFPDSNEPYFTVRFKDGDMLITSMLSCVYTPIKKRINKSEGGGQQ